MKQIGFIRIILACLGISISLFFTSCDQAENSADIPSTLEANDELEIQRINTQFQNFGKGVSTLVNKREVRELLSKWVGKRFDGDYNVLWKDISSVTLSDGRSMRDHLSESLATHVDPGVNREGVSGYLFEIENEHPQLQIAIPVHFDSWDPVAFTPSVTMIPIEYNEGETKELLAYSPKGESSWISAVREPENPYFVIGLNERTDEMGNLLPEYSNMYQTTREEGTETVASRSAAGCTYRNSGIGEGIWQVYVDNWGKVEGWTHGRCEWFLSILPTTEQKAPVELYFDSHKNKWSQINLDYFDWHWDLYGNLLYIVWIEKDHCGFRCRNVTSKFGVSDPSSGISLEHTITYKKADERAGAKYVSRRDVVWKEYNTGILRWYEWIQCN